jgi:uncharacterized protein (DUF1810 family)
MPNADDPYNLQRFVEAQARVYDAVRTELRQGRKRSHWMWFIFPQIAGLGHSAISMRYAISSLVEAEVYRKHPILGPRLRECTRLVMQVHGRSAYEILGSPDDMKLHSCLTLFSYAAPEDPLFREALEKYYDGAEDSLTMAKL